MKTISNLCYLAAVFLSILLVKVSYAYVADFEYISPEKRYEMDRSNYNHSDHGFLGDFPTFAEWMTQQQVAEDRLHDYLSQLASQIGQECAQTFDPSYVPKDDPSKPMSDFEWRAKYGND